MALPLDIKFIYKDCLFLRVKIKFDASNNESWVTVSNYADPLPIISVFNLPFSIYISFKKD